jgi:hypothetical protein
MADLSRIGIREKVKDFKDILIFNNRNMNMDEEKMNVKIIASTSPGYILPTRKALRFGGHMAAICYTDKSFDKIKDEKLENTIKRINMTLDNAHQSVYDHATYTIELSNVPKIMAMILNNLQDYTTSEKSARFTKMKPSPFEKELYDKWMGIFVNEIEKQYPHIDSGKRTKLAQENSRYLTSVFTRGNMGYTASLRQLNYIMHWFDEFIRTAKPTEFNKKLIEEMTNFNSDLSKLYVDKLDPTVKNRTLNLFATRNTFQESFGDTYSTTYLGSFAQLAQAHRHRTISYQMVPLDETPKLFFVPPIIEKSSHAKNWLTDMDKVAHLFPQGTLVSINERGTYENFISKAYERLCGQAQLEIQNQTRNTLGKYLQATENTNPEVFNALLPFNNGPRCTFPNYDCKSACSFGKKSLERLI